MILKFSWGASASSRHRRSDLAVVLPGICRVGLKAKGRIHRQIHNNGFDGWCCGLWESMHHSGWGAARNDVLVRAGTCPGEIIESEPKYKLRNDEWSFRGLVGKAEIVFRAVLGEGQGM